MSSVTRRIGEINQPRGGYISPKTLLVTEYNSDEVLFSLEDENISPLLVGTAVDSLTRFILTKDKVSTFMLSVMGATLINKVKDANKLLDSIQDLSDESIIAACKLVCFDAVVRAGLIAYKPFEEVNPDDKTIHNIRVMVTRAIDFFELNGPITMQGFTFEGAYTDIIDSGDGDYLTKDTLWDMKVSKDEPKPKYTLQILIYYLMGKRSVHKEFDSVKNIGLFNPRLNKAYLIAVDNIDEQTIREIEEYVIGY